MDIASVFPRALTEGRGKGYMSSVMEKRFYSMILKMCRSNRCTAADVRRSSRAITGILCKLS